VLNTGPHGLSEVLYAYTSAANTNGFAGLNDNTALATSGETSWRTSCRQRSTVDLNSKRSSGHESAG
jgi:Potassium-transporting ATPase A subunit